MKLIRPAKFLAALFLLGVYAMAMIHASLHMCRHAGDFDLVELSCPSHDEESSCDCCHDNAPKQSLGHECSCHTHGRIAAIDNLAHTCGCPDGRPCSSQICFAARDYFATAPTLLPAIVTVDLFFAQHVSLDDEGYLPSNLHPQLEYCDWESPPERSGYFPICSFRGPPTICL